MLIILSKNWEAFSLLGFQVITHYNDLPYNYLPLFLFIQKLADKIINAIALLNNYLFHFQTLTSVTKTQKFVSMASVETPQVLTYVSASRGIRFHRTERFART